MRDREVTIGGEFSVTCHEFIVNENRGAGAWPEYSGKRSIRCGSGRGALLLALYHRQHETGRRPDVWMPSYLCPSVPDVVCRAGLRVRIYEDSPGEVMQFGPPMPTDNDLVVIVHYFGHANRRALGWLSGLPSRRWGVIEDCVQAPYSAGVGVVGDYAITSLRKWWPAPDGATLHFRGEDWMPTLLEPDEGFISRRLMAKILRPLGLEAEAKHLILLAEAEARLEDSVAARRVSWASEILLDAADRKAMSQRRQQNWARLAAALRNVSGWETVFRPLYVTLAADTVPLTFPLRVDAQRRDPLRSHLASQRIFCPIHWPVGELPHGAAADLAGSMLSLPIDQRYDDDDMDSMAQAISNFFEGSDND